MSIIERAANRLDQNKEQQTAPASPYPDAAPQDPAAEAHAAVAPVVSQAAPPLPASSAAAPAPRATTKQAEIDLNRLSQLGFVGGGDAKSSIAEHFRMIKRPLLKKAFGKPDAHGNPLNLIMVTSSLPGEGKTFCSINLAMSIAMELDHTVLLVDADVSRPSVLRTLQVKADGGLMDILLEDKLDLADVMLKTNVDTLSVLPAGRPHPHATELLASQSMSLLLQEIASRYPDRIVIFDSPPLLLTSEARVLASKMGQIVLVVEAETTTQGAVKASLQQLKGCANVNLIYNKSRAFPGAEKYGYGYGYGTYYS